MDAFEIKEIKQVKSHLDGGSYGSINTIMVDGVYCIQKRVHDILLGLGNSEDVSKNQLEPLLKKFRFECKLLSTVHHPNVVQFMGIHYYGVKDGNKLISLVMEEQNGATTWVCGRNRLCLQNVSNAHILPLCGMRCQVATRSFARQCSRV